MNQTTLLFLSSNCLLYFRFDVMRQYVVANHVDSSPEKEKKKHFVVVSSRPATSNKKQQQQTSPNNNKVPTYITQLTSPSSLPSSYKKTNSNIFLHLHISIPHISLNLHGLYSFDSPPSEPVQIILREALGTEGTPKKKKIASVYVQPDWVAPQSRLERANITIRNLYKHIDRVNRVLVSPPFPGSFRAILTRYRPRTPPRPLFVTSFERCACRRSLGRKINGHYQRKNKKRLLSFFSQ